jgi:hypothetical protein
VRNWYAKAQQESGQIGRAADAMDRRVAKDAGTFAERPPLLRPNPSERRHPSEGG